MNTVIANIPPFPGNCWLLDTPKKLTMDAPDLKQPELYINRELSLLEFNWRVLEQAKDPSVPLMERLRYLAITLMNFLKFA